MDIIDRGILNDLLRNCRVTYQALATKYGISANAIKKRVAKLTETGIIRGYFLTVSREMLNATGTLGVLLTDGSQDEEALVERIGESPFIIAAASYTGGLYFLLAEHVTPRDLVELRSHLQGLPSVEKVEIHTLLEDRGSKMELTKLHRRVLRVLVTDPRMSIVDLAQHTGLTARRVRKIVQEMVDSRAILFSCSYGLVAKTSIPFLLRMSWDEKATDHVKVASWLMEQFPLQLWEYYNSVMEPTVYCLFSTEDMSAATAIARKIRQEDFVTSVTISISKFHRYFGGLRERYLTEITQGTD